MIAVDTNVLVYAHRREAKEHAVASSKLSELASGSEPWAIPWPCVYEFFSVVTNRRIWKDAVSTPAQAWLQISAGQQRASGELFIAFATKSEELERPALVKPNLSHAESPVDLQLVQTTRGPNHFDRDIGALPS